MDNLVDQNWAAAQWAVQDRKAQHKTVEAILAEAALTNAQLAVAKAVLKAEFRRKGATMEEAAASAEDAIEKMKGQLVFGTTRLQTKRKRQRTDSQVKVIYFRNLFHPEQGDGSAVVPVDQPVQLSMFAS